MLSAMATKSGCSALIRNARLDGTRCRRYAIHYAHAALSPHGMRRQTSTSLGRAIFAILIVFLLPRNDATRARSREGAHRIAGGDFSQRIQSAAGLSGRPRRPSFTCDRPAESYIEDLRMRPGNRELFLSLSRRSQPRLRQDRHARPFGARPRFRSAIERRGMLRTRS